MNLNNIKSLNIKKDNWILNHSTSLGSKISFDFTYLPNDWFKKVHKKITIDCITIGKPTLETLNRYNYGLRRFFEFLTHYEIELDTFEDLSYQYTQMYLYYLKQQNISKSTMNMSMAALKWVVNHGQHFQYEGFPENQVFDGDEYRATKVEDTLKTKYIPDNIIGQIESALKDEKNKMLKSLIEIGIDTGIRLSEALDLSKGCLTEDFTGRPVLYVVSKKNNTERFISVTDRVKQAVKTLERLSKKARRETKSDYLTVYWLKKGKPPRYDRLIQSVFRPMLKGFVRRHNITDENGNLYPLTYHAFRHTVGTRMLNNGMNPEEIATYLGHESLRSTAEYAKLKNPTVQKEYKKLGFIGMIVKEVNEKSINSKKLSHDTIRSAALPDGACTQPMDNQGNTCANLNMCVICPKFVTTPKHLSIHKEHLSRLQADREDYMASGYIGTEEHLSRIEGALITIIERLEEMNNG